MLDAGDRLNSQEEVLNTVVRRDGDGNFIRVGNLVTSARLSHRDPSVIPSVNGQSTVRLAVTKEENGNAIEISETVKNVAGNLKQNMHVMASRSFSQMTQPSKSTIR